MSRRFLLPDGTNVDVDEQDETVTCHCGGEMVVCCDRLVKLANYCGEVCESGYVCGACNDPCRVCGLTYQDDHTGNAPGIGPEDGG